MPPVGEAPALGEDNGTEEREYFASHKRPKLWAAPGSSPATSTRGFHCDTNRAPKNHHSNLQPPVDLTKKLKKSKKGLSELSSHQEGDLTGDIPNALPVESPEHEVLRKQIRSLSLKDKKALILVLQLDGRKKETISMKEFELVSPSDFP